MTTQPTQHNVPLRQLTTFQNQGSVQRVITVTTLDELQAYLAPSPSFTLIGKGSNMVISPEITCDLLKISPSFVPTPEHPIQCNGELLTVGAGLTVNRLMKLLIHHQLTGLEFMAGVPASVGGMVAMNFGCWEHCISDFIHNVQVMLPNGHRQIVSNKDLNFSYRYSDIQSNRWIVLSATFKLKSGDISVIKKKSDAAIHHRLTTQPLHEKTFGSVFKNPSHHYAAQLIDSLGLKGHVKGQVKISEKHANFFVNLGDATFDQLQEMVQFVQKRVYDTYHVRLEPEVKLLGKDIEK
jgi:UDP-N-acetylmuramate dehydrogenase